MKAGERFRSQNTTVEIIVVRGTDTEVELTCAGENMIGASAGPRPSPSTTQESDGRDQAVLLTGKRYVDEETGVEVLCTTAGVGPLCIDGRPLPTLAPKPLPSSD